MNVRIKILMSEILRLTRDLYIRMLFYLFACSACIQAQENVYTIDNGVVRREINSVNNHIASRSYKMLQEETEFLGGNSKEFSLSVDGIEYSGLSDWRNIRKRDTCDTNGGKGVILSFESATAPSLSIELAYMSYPGLPVIHKGLRVINNGSTDLKVENVDVESFCLFWPLEDARTNRQYARHKWPDGPYVGNWNDPLLVTYSLSGRKGLAIGNEAIGVTKRTAVFEGGNVVSVGLTHTDQDFAFRKWITPGSVWESPWVFTIPYAGTNDPYRVLNTDVSDFVRNYLGIRIENISHKPLFVYNTWSAFGRDLNDGLIRELAKAAAECGVEEFVIDDGWQFNVSATDNSIYQVGDWLIDSNKFPNGLKPVFDYIKSLGMKPGLWLSVGSAELASHVYKEHPEWFAADKKGQSVNLHDSSAELRTACMGTGWPQYIKNIILKLVKEHGLAYLKLDFAIVTSAYVHDKECTGCYSTDHPYHRDRNESFAVNYERCMQLFDELHEEVPELFIDCTYETAGKNHLIDYGIVKSAEGDWLSNINLRGPQGAMLVRRLAWERCPAIPATSLVIGNLFINDERADLAYKSLLGTLPVMLGDPRKLSTAQRAEYKKWATWVKQLEASHLFMSYRQDIPGFGEPQEGAWDGFCRVNTETDSGGLIGVFRQGAKEKRRTVTIPWLDPTKKYHIKKGYKGDVVAVLTGKELEEAGFEVTFNREYDGELFEVSSE